MKLIKFFMLLFSWFFFNFFIVSWSKIDLFKQVNENIICERKITYWVKKTRGNQLKVYSTFSYIILILLVSLSHIYSLIFMFTVWVYFYFYLWFDYNDNFLIWYLIHEKNWSLFLISLVANLDVSPLIHSLVILNKFINEVIEGTKLSFISLWVIKPHKFFWAPSNKRENPLNLLLSWLDGRIWYPDN